MYHVTSEESHNRITRRKKEGVKNDSGGGQSEARNIAGREYRVSKTFEEKGSDSRHACAHYTLTDRHAWHGCHIASIQIVVTCRKDYHDLGLANTK
jgi:hypothetical protein